MKQPKKIMSFIGHFVYQVKWQFLMMITARIIGLVSDNIIVPYAFKVFLDKIINFTGDKTMVWSVLIKPVIFLVAICLWIELLFRIFDFIKVQTMPALTAKIRINAVQYLQQHTYQFFVGRFGGDLARKVNDLAVGINETLLLLIKYFLPGMVTLVIGIVSFTKMHPSFGLLLGFWALLHIGIHLLYVKKCNYYTMVHAEINSALSGKVADIFSNILSIKLFPSKGHSIKYFKNYQDLEQRAYKKALSTIMGMHIITSILCVTFIGFGILYYMVYHWQQGRLNAAELTYIFTASWSIIVMVWDVMGQLSEFFEEIGIFRQAFKLLQEHHGIVDVPGAKALNCIKGVIKFENVSFHYEKDCILFHNKNVHIQSREKIGLVGFSGSGKSSFVHLILRFFEPKQGKITIDGQDISQVTQDSLRKHIAMIPQDTILFHHTIMENIRYGRSSATDNEVITASEAANCHSFVNKFPEGYQTLVGERGVKLSGGQRQRIAIARVFLKQAPILILDEATSALDAVTENSIQKSLKNLMEGKTTIMIGHRLSTLYSMDRILVFDKGKIVEEGTHAQLIQEEGHYAKMWQLQSAGFAMVDQC